ncbi:MAG: PA14 domain-containing protein, partial [Planctomycetota bacterium]|nr:PA14 domain-containing protein [Planctomycetota bacterium]
KYRIPDGTTPIPAGGFIVFDEYHNFGRAENPGVLIPFGFSELGEAAYLTGAAPDGSAGGYRESETLPATDRDVAYGRFIKSTGDKDFVAMAAATPGAENSYPAAGLVHLGDGTFADPGVVINEILYDPVAGTDEFIELYNLTDEAVPLYDPAHPGNRWKFTAGLGSNYSLPAGATIPAHGYALVVPIDPAAFRTKYGIPAGVPIYGPYTGSLSNNGEAVELARPGDPELDGTVPYYRVDRVNYSQAAPWPTRAGMAGSSIVRSVAGAYGNEPANWTAGTTGGTPGRAASPLDVTPPTVPAGLTAVSGLAQICLSWTGSTDPESGVAYYRIYRNNAGIGTSLTTSYTDALVVAGVAYSYQVSAVSRDDPESAKSNASAARIVTVTSVTPLSTTSDKVVFSEAMNKASAETVANYAITYATGSMTLSSASLASDNVTLTLTLSTPMVFDRLYTFTPTGVVITSGYTIAAGSQNTFNYYVAGTGYIYREWWTGITGTAVSNLTSNANYPNSPTGRAETNLFEAPSNFADNYGTRMRGYVTAPVTGTYYFWIASDDGSELWLNPNGEDPAGKVKIAYTTSATGSREWTKYATQKSAAITLQAGQRYYIEALQKEGSGNDFLAVTWQLPGATFSSTQAPIAGTYLSPIAPPLVTPDMTVTIAATTPTGNEASTVKGQCTVTRTGNLVPAVTVYYTVGGTATTTDFTAPSGWVTIVAGATTATIDVKPVDDTLDEPDETVILTLNPSHATYAVGSPASATVTIIDNDLPLVNIAATDPNAAEQGLDTGTFTFTRVGQLTSSLAVNFTISGTATRTTDYSGSPALVSGTNTFTFDVGVSSVIYVITPVDDAVIDAGETVILTISSNANYSRGTPNNATVTIADNDAPVVSIAATDPNAAEQGLDTGTFTVSRTGPTTASLTVNYTVAGTAASGIDFANIGTSVTLGVGVASKTITVTPVDDSASETAETVIVTLSTNGTLYTLDPAKVATVTIADNDPAVVTLLATDAAASEQGRDSGTFTLTRVGDLTAAVTVNYTVGGTATADDYGPTLGGSVAFGSGVASVTIVVTPVDDVADEIDETVILTLATGAGYGIGSPSSATVTIADNDLPAVVLRATDSHAYEAGQHKGTFTFTRDGYLGSALTAYYTVGGTAATSGAYNPALTGVVTFGVGQTSVTIDVTPVDDSIDEPMQAVVLALKPDANYVFGSSKSATVTIADNDLPTVSVTATDPLAAEAGLDKGTYTFTRVGDLSAALTLHYAVVGGTATPADYQPLAGYVTFEIGQAAATADLIPVDNQIT